MDNMGFKKLVILSLILVVFSSGCIKVEGEGEKFVPKDEALNLETEIIEKKERTRILPDQTIRMVVFLTNQVENDTTNVSLRISNPFGVRIQRVDCGSRCVCEWPDKKSGCDEGVSCTFNGCHYDAIQSQDQIEIDFSLKIPSEEEISYLGRDLKPEITLEYDYGGESVLYIPILRYGEKLKEAPTEFTQTKGPIHVDIESDKWVREGSIFPVYFRIKDVINSQSKLIIDNKSFEVYFPLEYVDVSECNPPLDKVSCSYIPADTCYRPKEDIRLPLEDPLVCSLVAKDPGAPMVKPPIIAKYRYRYKVEKTELIRIEKALLKVF
jgi:hypothetical protein